MILMLKDKFSEIVNSEFYKTYHKYKKRLITLLEDVQIVSSKKLINKRNKFIHFQDR